MIEEYDPPLVFNGHTYRYRFFLPDSVDRDRNVFVKFVKATGGVRIPPVEVGFGPEAQWGIRGIYVYLNDDAHALLFSSLLGEKDAP